MGQMEMKCIYKKNTLKIFQKSSSPEPAGQNQLNLEQIIFG
jgi:hypothetical protein